MGFCFPFITVFISDEEILLAVGGHGGFKPKKPYIVSHERAPDRVPLLFITYQRATPVRSWSRDL